MAKKYEFQPDKPYSGWLNKLQLTKLQQKQVLKWGLYVLVLGALSVIQDVVLSRMRLYGGTTDLVPCAIFLICIMEGSHRGSIFALAASLLYLMSGTSPGPHALVLITALGVLAAIVREVYLQPGLPSALLCTLLAMIVYEFAVFCMCLLLGYVTFGRITGFAVSALLTPLTVPLLYLIVKPLGAIGGRSWKE